MIMIMKMIMIMILIMMGEKSEKIKEALKASGLCEKLFFSFNINADEPIIYRYY